MNVLHLTGRSDHGGGPEHILQLATASRGWVEARIACPRRGLYWDRFQQAVGPDRVVEIPHRQVDPETIAILVRRLRAEPPDLIHSHGMAAGILGRVTSRLTGVPCVHSFHGVPVTTTAKHLAYRVIEPLLARWTAMSIAVSHGERQVILRRYPAYAGRVTVVTNGINMDGEEPSQRPHVPGMSVAMFARANQQKRPELVLAIAKRLSLLGIMDVRFDLYGEGLGTSSWAMRAVHAAAPIHCHGPTDDPRGVLDRADIYLSTSRWEGMPLALIEAFRSGSVVVASDVVGNRDVVTDGRNGLLFPEGNAEAAAAAISRLRAEPGLRQRLRAQAWEDCVSRHTRELMALRMLSCYRSVLNLGKIEAKDPAFAEPSLRGNASHLREAGLIAAAG